ncbi:MAG: AI-2E family transporter [Pseudomonadota bacterium]
MNDKSSERASAQEFYVGFFALPVLIALAWFGRDFLIPLAITALLFILLSALVDRFQAIKLQGWSPPGWLAHLMSVGTVFGALALIGLVISSSADEVQEALPRYKERFADLGNQVETFLGPRIVDAIRASVDSADVGEWASAAAAQLAGALSTFVLVGLYLAFLFSERTAWVEKLPRLARTEADTKRADKVLERISTGVKQYMWVNAVTSAMSGIVAYLIFWWIDLDFAPLLALIVFVAGFIPNIGAFIAITLPSLVALIQFDTLTPFLIVLFGYGAADQFIANVIQPSMQGRSLNMSTFMVMVSLTLWATLWGGIGAFLAIPMMVVSMVICAEFSATRWIAVLLSSDGLLQDEKAAASSDTETEPNDPAPQHRLMTPRQKKKAAFEAEVAQLRSDLENRDN